MVAELIFEHPQMDPVKRSGEWEVGDGERIIRFDDKKDPSEFFLIKRGVRYAFQSKQGLSNDDGSPLLLVRNQESRESHPIQLKLFLEIRVVLSSKVRVCKWINLENGTE